MNLIRSKFYYGFTVTLANNKLDFNEGSGELQANLKVGEYSLTTFLTEISRAMNAVGTQSYTVTVNRSTRIITVSAGSSFSLLAATGTRSGEGPWDLIGLAVDKTGVSVSGDDPAGSVFTPQFPLQSYIPSNNWQESVKAVVNESAYGDVEVVKFGSVKFTQFDIMFQTDKVQGAGNPIENDAAGVSNLRAFMAFACSKGLVEFMRDRSTVSSFETLRLESTELSGKGTGFKLDEMYDRGLPNYFGTGILKWRVI